LSDIEKTKSEASASASSVARQLMFAGLASVWLLREESERPLSNVLLFSLLSFSLALLTDLSQYVYCTVKWRRFYNDNQHKPDDFVVDIPASFVNPMYHFVTCKLALLGIGYALLIVGAVSKLKII